jgi:hypothetical protein
MSDQDSHPNKAKEEVVIVCIVMFELLEQTGKYNILHQNIASIV